MTWPVETFFQFTLKLRAGKCVFMQKQVKYLGHIELQVDPAKVEKAGQ